MLTGRPSVASPGKAVPLLLAILLLAAMNAFSEEMGYRAPQLTTSFEAVGEDQAMLLAAAFFGIGHYYGVPYGIIGVVMAGFLGWLLSKSMLETKSFSLAVVYPLPTRCSDFRLLGDQLNRGRWRVTF